MGDRLRVGDHGPVAGVQLGDVGTGRMAMKVSSAGGITRSAVPITAHDGMVFQAGGPDGSLKTLVGRGRWVVAMTAAC